MAEATPTRPKTFPEAAARLGALIVDLVLLVLTVPTIAGAAESARPAVTLLLFFVYFAALPLTTLQGTPGKRIFKLRLSDRSGARLRWPTAKDLGVADSTPFPAGGGYRLDRDGSVVIFFSVLPELKGRAITLQPKAAADGKVTWDCRGDPAFERRYLPGACRP